jgi:hypothetical protein
LINSIPGVAHQIKNNLLEPVCIGQDSGQRFVQVEDHLDIVQCELLSDNLNDIFDDDI